MKKRVRSAKKGDRTFVIVALIILVFLIVGSMTGWFGIGKEIGFNKNLAGRLWFFFGRCGDGVIQPGERCEVGRACSWISASCPSGSPKAIEMAESCRRDCSCEEKPSHIFTCGDGVIGDGKTPVNSCGIVEKCERDEDCGSPDGRVGTCIECGCVYSSGGFKAPPDEILNALFDEENPEEGPPFEPGRPEEVPPEPGRGGGKAIA